MYKIKNQIFVIFLLFIIVFSLFFYKIYSTQEGHGRVTYWNNNNNNNLYLINQQNDMNQYFIQKITGSKTNQLPNVTVLPGSNNILSFFIDYDGTKNGNWTQVIGITPDKSGSDIRYLSIWVCPSNSTLHIRTSTTTDGNKGILDNNNDCRGFRLDYDGDRKLDLPNTRRIDIIGNTNTSTLNQEYFIYDTLYKYQTTDIIRNTTQIGSSVTTSPQTYKNYKESVYIYSSYSNWEHVPFNVYNVMFITGKQSFNLDTVNTCLSGFLNALQSK